MKAVLFDLDGTLVKAGGAGRKALNRAIHELLGVRDACSEFSLAGRTDLDNFRLAFRAAAGRDPNAAESEKIRALYLRRLPGEVRKAVRAGRYELVPGIRRLLAALKRRKDVLIGLGTGNLKPGAWLKLEPSGLTPYFSFGGFGCDGFTRVRVLRTAVRRARELAGLPIPPERVYVIGDTHKDVRAGKAAGYRTAAVTTGFGDLPSIQKAAPDLIAEDFRDVDLWLAWIS